MAIQKSSTKTALDLGNFESVVDEKLNSIFQGLTKNQTIIDKSISYALSNPRQKNSTYSCLSSRGLFGNRNITPRKHC